MLKWKWRSIYIASRPSDDVSGRTDLYESFQRFSIRSPAPPFIFRRTLIRNCGEHFKPLRPTTKLIGTPWTGAEPATIVLDLTKQPGSLFTQAKLVLGRCTRDTTFRLSRDGLGPHFFALNIVEGALRFEPFLDEAHDCNRDHIVLGEEDHPYVVVDQEHQGSISDVPPSPDELVISFKKSAFYKDGLTLEASVDLFERWQNVSHVKLFRDLRILSYSLRKVHMTPDI